jgi:uncharacterized coiled-coil protein SlyX
MVYIYAEPVDGESAPRYKAYPGEPGISPAIGIREWTAVDHEETYNGCVYVVDEQGSRVQIPGLGQETLLDRVVFLELTAAEQERRIGSLYSESSKQKFTIRSLEESRAQQSREIESLKTSNSSLTRTVTDLTVSLERLSKKIENRSSP